MQLTKNKLYQLIQEQLSDEERQYWGQGLSDISDAPEATLATTPSISKDSIEWWEQYGFDLTVKYEFPWIEKHIGKQIGQGAFRKVYQFGKNRVMKIPYASVDQKLGQAVNVAEGLLFNQYPNLFPKAFAYDEKGRWLICEEVYVLKDKETFLRNLFEYFPALDRIYRILLNDEKGSKELFRNNVDGMGILFGQIKKVFENEKKGNWFKAEKHFKEFFAYRDFDPQNVDACWNILTQDASKGATNFSVWFRTILKLDIQPWDIREDNVGLTSDGKFVIIDISIFGDNVVEKAKRVFKIDKPYDHSKKDISKDEEWQQVRPGQWRRK